MLALNIIIYRFQVGFRRVSWTCRWKSELKSIHIQWIYIYIYVHTCIIITCLEDKINRPPNRKSCFLLLYTTKEKYVALLVFKEEESLHEKYRAAFAKLEDWGSWVNGCQAVRSGCCATIILRKQDAGWDDTPRWLEMIGCCFFQPEYVSICFWYFGSFFLKDEDSVHTWIL